MNDVFRDAVKHDSDCPRLEWLLDAPARFAVHLERCTACRTELALFQHFDDAPATAEEGSAVRSVVSKLKRDASEAPSRDWRRFFQPAWLGAAAVAAAAVIFAVGIGFQGRTGQVPSENTEATEQMRSRSVRITSPHGDVDRLPQTVQWRPVDGAAGYQITVAEVDGTVIIHKNVTGSSFNLPDSTFTLMNSGKTVRVNIAAVNPSGNEIANSGPITIHVSQK